jgi:hypothetical protein
MLHVHVHMYLAEDLHARSLPAAEPAVRSRSILDARQLLDASCLAGTTPM